MYKPGKHELTNFNDTRLFASICRFIGSVRDPCCDIGKINKKSIYLRKCLGVDIKQVEADDFNFEKLKGKYNTILCFEVLEHLQNPLWFMNELKNILSHDGTIYLSSPGRPKILWTKYHYNELTPSRFNKWILDPLDMKIVRRTKLRPTHSLWFYLSGFRPLLRIFLNYTNLYEIKVN